MPLLGTVRIEDPDNIGYGFWTHQWQAAAAWYPFENKGTAVTGVATYEYHAEKEDFDLQPGENVTLNWGVSQYIPLTSDQHLLLEIGPAGWNGWQVSADSGSDAIEQPARPHARRGRAARRHLSAVVPGRELPRLLRVRDPEPLPGLFTGTEPREEVLKDAAMARWDRTQGRALLPISEWLFAYRKEWLRPDVIAGATTAAVVIPKAMAYATVAGLPVEVGLYTVFVPMLVYAIVGTSRVLSVSTTTTIAILAGTQLAQVVPDGDRAALLAAAATLTLLVGGLLALASLLRLGFVANFISEPVLVGFKAGIGLVIVLDQVPKLLGVHFAKGGFFQNLVRLVESLPDTSLATLAVALATLAILLGLERFAAARARAADRGRGGNRRVRPALRCPSSRSARCRRASRTSFGPISRSSPRSGRARSASR